MILSANSKINHMKIIIAAGLFLAVLSANAQNPVLPSGSKPGQLPAPKVKMLAKPDLFVTAINFVSLTRNGDFAIVRVSVTIKNAGGLRVGETKLRGERAGASSGRPDGWKRMNESLNVASIDPGKSITAEYAFRIEGPITTKKFAIKVFVDATGIVTESNETNNYSANLIITPPTN